MDKNTDVQRETIIPSPYRVKGYEIAGWVVNTFDPFPTSLLVLKHFYLV